MEEFEGIFKTIKRLIIPIVIIIFVLMIIIGGAYTIFKSDFSELAEQQKAYRDSIKVTPEGIERTRDK